MNNGKINGGIVWVLNLILNAIKVKTDQLAGAAGIFFEQPSVPVSINAIVAFETDVLHFNAANTRYILRKLTLKGVDPGVNEVMVTIYQLVNGVLTNAGTYNISTDNFGTHFDLMTLFGIPSIAGDEIRITVQASAGGPYAITAQYSFAKTNN